MKYVLYLVAKIAVVIGMSCLLEALLISLYPKSPQHLPWLGTKPTLGALVFFLGTLLVWSLGSAMLFFALWDQRRRCRTCLRKLIMPVETGSWANIVMLGRPRVALICPFGHGTLTEEELHIGGRPPVDWQPHDDNIWKELESYGEAERNRR